MKSFIFIFLTCAALTSAARAESGANDPLVLTGEDHPAPNLADFTVTAESSKLSIEAKWVEKSVRWLRAKDGLPVPRAQFF